VSGGTYESHLHKLSCASDFCKKLSDMSCSVHNSKIISKMSKTRSKISIFPDAKQYRELLIANDIITVSIAGTNQADSECHKLC